MPRHDPLIRPPRLSAGDRVRVVAPASPFDRGRFERGVETIRSLGFEPVWRDDVFAARGYLAGEDDRRAAELEEAFADPSAKGIVCARGGYGSTRLLARLDFRSLVRTPKVFLGFSDVTGLLLGFAKAGMATFHGPTATGRLADAALTDLERESLLRAVTRPEAAGRIATGRVVVPGRAEGPLLGGTLALVASLVGTPYLPDLDGAIVFLEDVNEKPYRIDRMLTQLALAGALDRIAGVALGRFSRCADAGEPSTTAEAVLAEWARSLGKPCVLDLPFGHDGENVTLPVGVRAEIRASGEEGTLAVTEAAVT